mmetsp:Transcript_53703/g.114060  ORF Transcript_53703/g.114060 Transcript_53703/m.114060 type:complete len:875 (-) Transcript_53703:197-2821(-)
MMVDNNVPAGHGGLIGVGMQQEVGGEGAVGDSDESQHLLGSSPLYHDSLLNDLTYSDDDETDEHWDSAELGVSGSTSTTSPDTARLLDDIQTAMFPTQQTSARHQQQRESSHLMHPLARQESEGNDEGSYLAYSIASSHGGDSGASLRNSTETLRSSTESQKNSTEDARQAVSLALGSGSGANYGSIEAYIKSKATTVVTFRPPSSVFDRTTRSNSAGRPHQQRSRRWRPRRNSPPNASLRPHPHPSSANGDGGPPATPFPSISESPVTSATTTDDTKSPKNEDGHDQEEEPEKERITRLLSAEASRRQRRHRRLRRIKKAAEAREAAVQEVRGVEQRPGGCNDAIFAFIFLCQFLLVSMSALAFGPGALRDKIYTVMNGGNGEKGGEEGVDYNPFAGLQTDDVIIMNSPFEPRSSDGRGTGAIGGGDTLEEVLEEDLAEGISQISHIDYVNVIQLVCIASGYATLCSLLTLGFMMMLSKNLLHATLIFSIVLSFAWTVLGWEFGSGYSLPISGAIALVLSSAYAVVVWDRVPFAATNLSVALKGMRSTLDVPIVGVCVLAITFLWTIWWICAFVGMFDFLNDDEGLSNDWMSVVLVFFLFSYYWTFQVIKGISRTTVASIIGKWWDMSEEEPLPLCSSVLHGSVSRTVIRSFGSICLGSLIVGPCMMLTRISMFLRLAKPKLDKLANSPEVSRGASEKGIDNAGRPSKNAQCKSGHDCVVSRNVNRWSFTYVGLYGYKFWESGGRASKLFEARGWTHVVSDDLIMTAMFMSSMIIGGTTACLGLIVEEMDGYSFPSQKKPISTAFLICLILGFFLSSAFLSIIEGSVSAILVCYATAPVEFHANHHKLSEEMKNAWKHFWLQKPTAAGNNNVR